MAEARGLSSMKGEATASVATTYDDLDRPKDVTASGPAGTFRTQVSYDVADLPLSVTYTAFGQTVLTVANTYAKTNELLNKTAAGKTWSFSFAQGGALSTYWSDRTLQTRSLDIYGRLAAVRTGFKYPGYTYFNDLFESRLAYDPRDRIASTELASNHSSLTEYTDGYGYDLADRLIDWDRTGDVQDGATYSWDAAGNLEELRRSGEETTTFTSDADNRLTTAVTGSAVTTYTSDTYGRRTTRLSSAEGTTTYSRDPLGHLVEITSADATSTYEYGISGMRERVTVETTAGVTWRESVWSGGQLIAERDSDYTTLTYVWGPDRTPLAVKVASYTHPSGTYYYHTDAAGSVVALTDESGEVVASYRYDAFGALTDIGGSDAWLAGRNPLRYRAYYADDETGLYYLPARYYEPSTARFLSPDPAPPSAGDPLSLNAYAYCQGDPVNLQDPDGARHEAGGGASRVHDDAIELAKKGHVKEAKSVQKYYKQRLARAYAEGYSWLDANYPAYSQAEYYAKGIWEHWNSEPAANRPWPSPEYGEWYQDHNVSFPVGWFPLTGGWFNNKVGGRTLDRHPYIGGSYGYPPAGLSYMRGKGHSDPGIYVQLSGGGLWGGAAGGGIRFTDWHITGFLEEGPCVPFVSGSAYFVL